jgi:hypothetical protein
VLSGEVAGPAGLGLRQPVDDVGVGVEGPGHGVTLGAGARSLRHRPVTLVRPRTPPGVLGALDGSAFHKAFMAEIVSGEHERREDAVLAAQAAYAETGVMPELLAVYHLFGDPGLTIR